MHENFFSFFSSSGMVNFLHTTSTKGLEFQLKLNPTLYEHKTCPGFILGHLLIISPASTLIRRQTDGPTFRWKQ